ncbi:MAG: hypothetical protein M1833_004369 [Piccolia ochrophora]|nr:MAG: hypothetical protein M1833_004369 [Piccolia ochrophora]
MANPETSVADQIAHLEAARKLVLGDSVFYTQIIQGILPVIDSKARIEFRRWGAEFLAETFASPMLAVQQKESLGLMVLETLKDMLEVPSEDSILLKNAIQACASIYPLIFRHILSDANDTATWKNVAAIKSRVLKLWDTASGGIRMCCIKFVQKVIQVQTPGLIADPRRPEQNEISLALVPRNHPLIPPSSLEAETAALLDRLLSVFEENS